MAGWWDAQPSRDEDFEELAALNAGVLREVLPAPSTRLDIFLRGSIFALDPARSWGNSEQLSRKPGLPAGVGEAGSTPSAPR